MKINELMINEQRIPDVSETPSGVYDPSGDKVNRLSLDDVNKPKLTLKHLNKLKKIRATKELEMAQNRELLDIMYGGSSDDD